MPSFTTMLDDPPLASSSSVPAPPTVIAFVATPALSTVIVPFVVMSEALPPPDCDSRRTVTASDPVIVMLPLAEFTRSSDATLVSIALDEPIPVAVTMTSRPLVASMSTAPLVSASITPPAVLWICTARLLELVVTSFPSVTSPPALRSISPEPALRTVTLVLSSVMTIRPPVDVPAMT